MCKAPEQVEPGPFQSRGDAAGQVDLVAVAGGNVVLGLSDPLNVPRPGGV